MEARNLALLAQTPPQVNGEEGVAALQAAQKKAIEQAPFGNPPTDRETLNLRRHHILQQADQRYQELNIAGFPAAFKQVSKTLTTTRKKELRALRRD